MRRSSHGEGRIVQTGGKKKGGVWGGKEIVLKRGKGRTIKDYLAVYDESPHRQL